TMGDAAAGIARSFACRADLRPGGPVSRRRGIRCALEYPGEYGRPSFRAGGIVRTRIKICGISRAEDARAAAEAGADAIGLVFYPPSPRCLSVEWARQLALDLPPFVSAVALFVNPTAAEVYTVLERVRPAMLQFHGEEDPVFCAQFGVPYIKACRVRPG